MKEKFEGVYIIDKKIAVANLVKGYSPFGDQIVKVGKKEYLLWNPMRSKLAAAIVKGLKFLPLHKGSKVLYIGIAHGYTASKVACIVGNEGIIYGIEFSDRPFVELLPVAKRYGNIVPILADARMPENYLWIEKVDAIFCDIADPQMSEAAIRNAEAFLKTDGYLMIAIKARSIDVTARPKAVVENEIRKFKRAGFEIVQRMMLDPFERDHGFILAQKV